MTTEPNDDSRDKNMLSLQRELATARSELDALRKDRDAVIRDRDDAIKSRDGLKEQLEKQKGEFEVKLTEATTAAEQAKVAADEAAKNAKAQADTAVIRANAEAAAVRMGAVAPEDVVKLIDLSTVTMDENGKIDGLDAVMQAAKESRAYLFTEPAKPGTETGTTKTAPAPKAGDPAAFDATKADPKDVQEGARALGLRWPATV